MRDLIRKHQQDKEKLAVLQVAVTLGIDSGQTGELGMKSIKQKARQLAGFE